jgi:hypothetical protein
MDVRVRIVDREDEDERVFAPLPARQLATIR